MATFPSSNSEAQLVAGTTTTGSSQVTPPSCEVVMSWVWYPPQSAGPSASNARTTVPRFTSNDSQRSQLTPSDRRGRSPMVQVRPPSNEVATWMVWYGQSSLSEAVTMSSGSRLSTAIDGSAVETPYP